MCIFFVFYRLIVLLKGTPLLIGLSITVGSLPAVIYLFFAEKIVDYCGHSNILILCFVNYIVHFTGKFYFITITIVIYTTPIKCLKSSKVVPISF